MTDLSPGEFHKSVPTDPEENVAFRGFVLREAMKSKRLQAELREACRRDFFFWINTFVWQINPRKFDDEVGPFVLFPFQGPVLRRTLARLFGEQQAMIWEKSRYQGATWLMLLVFIWLCLFHRNKSFLLISHTEDAVYKGDDDSLFKKVEFVLEYLPDWMIRGATRKASAKKLTFNFPATKSFIAGGANTSRIGVGQRFTAIGCDEFAKQPNAVDILSNTADTGPRLFVSTHYGVGTSFYAMCYPGAGRPDPVKEVMHWSECPLQNAGLYRSDAGLADGDRPHDKTYVYSPDFQFTRDGKPHGGPKPGLRSPWYDLEVQERIALGGSERDIAMHLDIDAQGSTFQYFQPAVIRRLQNTTCRPPTARYDAVLDSDTCVIDRLEPQDGGDLWLWCDLDYNGRPPEDFYSIGGDFAAGTGATPTCFSIVNSLGEKVGAWTNARLEPHEYSPLFIGLGRLFWNAILTIETGGPGSKVMKRVLDARYPLVYMRPKNESARVREPSNKPGWHNQKDTATLLLRNYKEALVASPPRFVNRCKIALGECLDYVYVNGSIEHTGRKDAKDDPSGARENHGDRVIADALAYLGLVSSNRLRSAGEVEEARVALHPGSRAGREAMARSARETSRPQAGWLTRMRA